VAGAPAAPAAPLDGCAHLFCGLPCERSYFLKTGSGPIRRELFRLERGVCTLCRLDCHGLLQQLQAIRRRARTALRCRSSLFPLSSCLPPR